jgi:HK97 family phage portal protein
MAGADVPIAAAEYNSTAAKGKSFYAVARSFRAQGLEWPEAIYEAKRSLGMTEIHDHPALQLLNAPYPEAGITGHELIHIVLTYLELCGNSYVEKLYPEGKPKRPENIIRLWPKIDPRCIWVIPGEKELISGFVYKSGGKTVVFSRDEMMQIAYFHPENPYYGLAPTEVLRTALIADIRAIDWNRIFFENDATPGLVLSTDQHLTPQQAEAVREHWRDRYQGVQKSHRIAVLSNGLKIQTISPTHTDMDFLNLRGWNREEILAVYGVPPIVVGLYKDANRAAAATMRRLFYEQTVIPRLGKLEATLTAELIPSGEPVKLFFDLGAIEALHEQIDEKANTGKILLSQGWSLNELRRWWNLPPATGPATDVVWAPGLWQPAGRVEEPEVTGQKSAKIIKRGDVPLAGDPFDFIPPTDLEKARQIHIPYLIKIGMEGSEWAGEHLAEIGIKLPDNWQIVWGWRDRIAQWIERHTAELVRQIDDTTRQQIVEIIRTGIDEGLGAKEIAAMIRDQFAHMGKTRAQTIARTEGTYAVNWAQHHLYVEAGVDRHRWQSTLDARVRDIHAAAHGQEIEIDKPFLVGGEYLMYPGDTSLGASPHNVINCRCAELAITSGYNPTREQGNLFWWMREAWLRSLETRTIGDYEKALMQWFLEEGERYAAWLLERAGV